MDQNKQEPLKISKDFFKQLDFSDEKVLANIELGIDLYTGKHDRKEPGGAAVNFERALGIFSVSYVRIAQEIFRRRETMLTPEQKLFLNFGILDERIIQNDKVTQMLCEEITRKYHVEKFETYYMNEWMERIARGSINPTSDVAQIKSKTKAREAEDKLREKKHKLEEELGHLFKQENDRFTELKGLQKLFSPEGAQGEKLKILTTTRKKIVQLEHIISEQNIRLAELESIKMKESDGEDDGTPAGGRSSAKFTRIREEFDLLITIMRSCAARGRLIKNTPVLIDKWIPLDSRLNINTRENVEKLLEESEAIDHTIFFDSAGIRKAPKVLIVPGIGTGMAWKDRMMIPLFAPPALQPDISIIRTLAGFRWHLTTMSFNWKELPGEIGSMYRLIYPELTYAGLERSFTEDYVKWITKEALGFQVLPPPVRSLFWKKIPFSTEHKQNLAKRATVYAKLYAADVTLGR